MGLYPVAVSYGARQDNTIQYNTIQYSTVQHDTITHITKITYNTQGSPLYAKLQKEIKNTYYTVLRLRNRT